MSIRLRKKLKTQQDILQAALKLFSKKGYEAVSVEDIADSAGISPRTFYRYYPGKADLISMFFNSFKDTVQKRASVKDSRESDFDFIESVLKEVFSEINAAFSLNKPLWREAIKTMEKTPALQSNVLQKMSSAENILVKALLSRGPTSNEREIKVRLMSACAIAIGKTLTINHILSNQRGKLSEAFEKAVAMLQKGLD